MEPYAGGTAAECTLCGGEIYTDEPYYFINGQSLCRDCLSDYAARFFAPYLVKGSERCHRHGNAI